MKVTRIAVGISLLTLVAVSAVRAQQAVAHARQEQDEARTLLERSLQGADAARAAEEAQLVLQKHWEKAREQAGEHANRSHAIAEHVREALARGGHFDELKSPEWWRKLEEELARVAQGIQGLDRARILGEVEHARGELGLALQRLGRGDGSSRRLEERVRALEQRLGMIPDGPGRPLEERVAELERRTMGGIVPNAEVYAPRSSSAVPGEPAVPGIEAPESAGPRPPREQRREAEGAPHAKPRRFDPYETAVPSAPQPRAGHALTPERRRDIEDVMRRMRQEMERLREEMNRLRNELGRNGDLEKLRELGYRDESEGSRGR